MGCKNCRSSTEELTIAHTPSQEPPDPAHHQQMLQNDPNRHAQGSLRHSGGKMATVINVEPLDESKSDEEFLAVTRETPRNLQNSQSKLRIQRDKFVKVKNEKVSLHYKVVKKLGEGSYGSVYKVVCKHTMQERAMKIIRKADVTDQENVFAELEVLKQLDHPNILKLYEVFEEEDFFYVLTQYCEGGEVLKALKKSRQLNEKNVAQLMRQLFGALLYMHDRNIVHRDLKLENLLYENSSGKKFDGTETPIKIIDFGTSRLVSPDKALHAKMGSPFYVAPEVLLRNYNIKCDIWSCGVIMYILLCGHPPFSGKNVDEIFKQIQEAPLEFEDSIWEEISPEAIELIKSMLNRNVALRPSAQDVLNSHWVQNCSASRNIDGRILKNLERFYFQDRFKAVVLTYLASNTMSKQERRALAMKFNEIDQDRSGVIERHELIEAYRSMYQVVEDEAIERILNNLDTNGSGKVDFTEFMVAASETQKLLQDHALLQAFEFFDSDHTGFLDINELRQLLGNADEEELQRVMKEMDTNLDQQISREEFVKMLRHNSPI